MHRPRESEPACKRDLPGRVSTGMVIQKRIAGSSRATFCIKLVTGLLHRLLSVTVLKHFAMSRRGSLCIWLFCAPTSERWHFWGLNDGVIYLH